jgi:transposase
MSYIVEQKIRGDIYLYEAESYWDKEKKQARQRRKYIGPKNAKKKSKTKQRKSWLISKSFGTVFLLNFLSNKLGVSEILKTHFPQCHSEILGLAYFEIIEGSAFYLFPYWIDGQFLPNTKKLHSPDISGLCETIGRSQLQRYEFVQNWIEHIRPINGIYYDITSISSYSTNIDFIEWGYNRDKEHLPQLNMGVVFCQNNTLPILYNIYPGSIVDVTTLKNCIKHFDILGLKEILLVLDRGFFSKSNILELNNEKRNTKFILPLPFRLKKVKELLRKSKKNIANTMNSFKYKEEVLFYLRDRMEFDQKSFDAHVFFNEKAEVDQRHNFLSCLLDIENKFKAKKFETLKKYMTFKKSEIPLKYAEYFKWNKQTLKIEKNPRKIREHISSIGNFILLTNNPEMDKTDVLDHYRRRDRVEKIFNIVKNEIDGRRLRAHGNFNNEGRLFIKFIALIIHTEISKIMHKKKLFEKYSIKEMLAELTKLKITTIEDHDPIIGELTKKQKMIFKAFGITEDQIASHTS